MFVTVAQMIRAERRAIERLRIASRTLMFNAGRSVAEMVRAEFPRAKSISIAAGLGNNGGDGFVAGLLLADRVSRVTVLSLGSRETFSADARHFLDRCSEKKNISIAFPKSPNLKSLQQSDVIVDALLGTGLQFPLPQKFRTAIESINGGPSIVAVDIPSGLHGDTGETDGACVRAAYTVTFARPKLGLRDREQYTGMVVVRDIGIPEVCFDDAKWT
jgi:NAD(P)H-hydrate epimerase